MTKPQFQYGPALALISLIGTTAGISPALAQNITPANDGTGTVINNNGQQFDITGGTSSANGANLFHSFQQFNVDAGQTANFISAPNIQNILGRVTGGDASIINGLITVTGGHSNLYLMNPVGVIFGPNARLDVPASFSVTTATGIGFGNNWFNAIGNNDYQSLVGTPNRYRFDVSQPGAVVNAGNLELSPGEDLTLTGGTIINTGELSTPGGSVTIAAVEGGDTIRISQPGHLLNLEISRQESENRRTGVSPVSLPGLLTEGNFNPHATGMTVNENGQVVLFSEARGNRQEARGGGVFVSGTIDTSSSNIGGEVNIVGRRVGILDANINADGINGGGEVFIGGAFQGNNRLPASEQTVINNSNISANALENGGGGRVIIWSDGTTRFNGNISATGGVNFGDGGFVEVSGKERLIVDGNIDAGAANGDTGTILFDPRNILIDERGTTNDEGENIDPFAEDENGDVTIAASQLEELEGEIVLQADNDITVNQEINTSESVEFNAGKSININADIDTSSGNGNISLFGNDNGANASNRSQGPANINQRENTTLNAGSGNITIRLGSLGEVGDINLANLTTSRRVLIDSNGGNIGRVSANSLIVAGDASLTTREVGGIGLPEEPLRVEVNNLEATAGSGGVFLSSSQGLNVRGITARGGGNIQLTVEGDVTATGDISTATGERDAGNIDIISSGGIDSRESKISATSESGSGGDISLRAAGDIETRDVNARVRSNGEGGNITLESTGGAIATIGGVLDTSSIGGNGGSIELNAAGDITAGTLRAASRNRGKIKDGNVEFLGEVSPPDPEELFGEVSFSTEEQNNGRGGAIALTAGGDIDTTNGAINSSSSTGRGANVTLNATGGIRTAGINSSGTNRRGGNITLSSSGGGVDTREGVLDARSQLGNGGNITLEAARNVRTQRLLSGTMATVIPRDGGDVTITAGRAIDTTGGLVVSGSRMGSGGNVVMRASGDVRTEEVITQGGLLGKGGNITIESSGGAIDVSLGELDAGALGGDGGNILLETGGDIITESLSTASRESFEIELELVGGFELESLALIDELTSSLGVSGSGGNITLRAGGEIVSLGAIDSSSAFGSAGNISLSAIGDGNLDEIISSAGGIGDGGKIAIESSGGAIAVSGFIDSSSSGTGNGGSIDLNAAGDMSISGVYSGASANNSGNGGSISITAGGSLDAIGGEVDSSSARGEGGEIAITATGNIIAAGVRALGSSRGGEIAITSSDGAVNTTQGAIDASAQRGVGGDIAINANDVVVTGDVISSGRRRGGNIDITSAVSDVDTSSGELDGSSQNGAGGDVTISAPLGSVAIGRVAAGEVVTDEGDLAAGLETEIENATQEDITETEGSVKLEAHNDITIDEAIASDSISNLEMRAGRNININANINTARANGDITLTANDGGADADLRGRGRGNLRMAEGTTINSGRGDITISLGTFGSDNNIGSITLGNIRTRGTLSVNARGGNILSVSDSSLLRAETAIFQTFGSGGIGISESPLRVDVNILEAKAGSGGAFFYSPNGGLTVGSNEEELSGILTTGGGDVEIVVEGDLTVAESVSTAVDRGPSGNISLTATGAIDTSETVLTSISRIGRSGNVTLTGDGDVTVGNINSYSSERGRGGNIVINSGGAIDTTAGALISRANNGDGGDITLSSDRDLTVGTIESISQEEGNGGWISLDSSSGNIDTTKGPISSTASGGDGGEIFITAAEGNVSAGNIFSESSPPDRNFVVLGRGGNIVISAGGNVDTTGGEISSSSSFGNGGDIAIAAQGNIEAGEIQSNSGLGGGEAAEGIEGAGNIELNAGGFIDTTGETLSSVSSGGSGGNITLRSNEDIKTGSINTFSEGSGSGGNITLDSRRGAIDTSEGELSSFSSAGNGGNIEIEARLNVLTGDINTLSLSRGGSISIESRQGSIDTTEGQLNSNSTSGRGGDVNLNANRDILTGDINSFSAGRGQGGNITIDSQNGAIDTTQGQLTSNSFGGSGGDIAIAGTRDILTGKITSIAESNGSAGNISIETTGGAIDTTAGRLSSSSMGGDGGNVSLMATGDINTEVIDSFSKGNGNGGNITLDSGGNIDTTAGLLSSRADGNGNGGNVTVTADGNINASLVESFSDGSGRGGNIVLDAGGDIDTTGELVIQIGGAAMKEGELLSRSRRGDGGNVTLRADGNINTALVESLSDGRGRGGNIVMDAGGDIDTTAGELISRSRRGAGGDVSLTSGGNLSALAIESLSENGEGGDINLTAVGDIDTTEGGLVSRSQTGDGGNVTLSSSEGNISTAAIESLSENGKGGDINLTAAGEIDTTLGELTSRSQEGDGGNVALSSGGNISTAAIESLSIEGEGGNINLDAGGDIDTTGEGATTETGLVSRSQTGDGGSVTLSSGGSVSTAAIESLSENGKGGDINVTAAGEIDTTLGELTSRSREGDGGSVALNSGGNISTAEIESLSKEGRGGDISLNAEGAIDTTLGQLISESETGEGGNVSLRSEGDISTGYIESFSGRGPRGGNIEIVSDNGSVNTTLGNLSGEPQIAPNADVSTEEVATTFETEPANLSSYAPEGIGGRVSIEARSNVTTSHISSFGGEDSGDVRITAGGNIDTGVLFSTAIEGIGGEIDIVSSGDGVAIEHVAAYSQNGSGGEIEIGASGNVEINNVASFGPQQSGDVTIISDGGSITTGTIQTRAPNGTSGNITLNTFSVLGDIRTANVTTAGGQAAGEVQILAADGSVTTENLESSSTGGTAGGIDVQAGGGDVQTGDQTVNAAEGDANINVGASGDISTGNQTATTNDGNASINNVAGGDITTGDQIATADGGNASINNVAGGDITTGDQIATADGGNASINNVAGGDITTGDQIATAFGGDASINNVAGGNITTGDQTALSEGGNALINNDAGGNLITGEQTAVAPDGINQVTNNAGGAIDTGELVQGGSDITPFLNNNPVLVTGSGELGIGNGELGIGNGAVTPPTQPAIVPTQPPVAVTPPTQPAIVPTQPSVTATPPTQPAIVPTQAPAVVTPPTQAPVVVTPATQAPAVVTPPTQAQVAVTPPTQAPAVVTPPTQAPAVVTPATQAPVAPTQPLLAIEQPPTAPQAVRANSQFSIPNSLFPNPGAITVAANSQTLTAIEQNRTEEFADYLGLDPSEELNVTKNVREILSDIAEQTGNRSAVVYVSAYAEELQLILYTPEGEPILKTIPGVKREEVMKTAQQFRGNIVTSLRLRNAKTYLPPAQQLYKWLIAPIAAELEAANIDTLLFSMDEGLRGIPIAALHDGEQFLIESYSLSLIPSISLMDSRYRSVKDARVLAMGASEFVELNPLPAVPLEVEAIAERLWEGRGFLNEEFTLDNLIGQRQDYAYPIIHLATHGQFKPGDASNSYIQFWGSQRLSLDRVRELGLNAPAVELLVLSACRTALGDTNAELGFAGLAVAAGVKSALASLWYVSDEGTLGLMTEFYSNLDDTVIKAEALREAQLAMLRGEVRIEGGELRGSAARGGALLLPPALAHIVNSQLSHPYYWSAFTIIGSPW